MLFDHLSKAPPDPVFGLLSDYSLDPRKNKCYLGIGIYQDEFGNMPNFEAVLKAQKIIGENPRNASYLPFQGNSEFVNRFAELIFGETLWKSVVSRTYGAQTLGSSGAIRLGMDFLCSHISKCVSFFEPTWPNHLQILQRVNMEISTCTYLVNHTQLDFNHIIDFITKLPEQCTVLLQPSCHNPSGIDFTVDQWKELSLIFARKRLIPFFDLAYQGLGDSLDDDAYPIRIFAEQDHEMFIAATCSKNFGLYCQRVGALYVITSNPSSKDNVASHLNRIIRTSYSNPPAYGADLVEEILKNSQLKKMWMNELSDIQSRIKYLRRSFVDLMNQKANENFDFLLKHKGMFSLIGLDEHKIRTLREEFGVYLSKNGRLNFAGLNQKNMEYIVDAIVKVM